MGKKVYNAKARQSHKTVIDNSETKKIKVELGDLGATYSGYDEANALVLPSKKRKTKTKLEVTHHTKILSKKQRKRLEAVVAKKQRKEQTASLLEGLAKVQIPQEELNLYQSITQVQTIGLKNFGKLDELLEKQKRKKEQRQQETGAGRISSIAGMSKRKRMELLKGYNDADESDSDGETKAKKKNPNLVGLEEEGSSSDDAEGEVNDKDKDIPALKPELKEEPLKKKEGLEKAPVSSKPAVFIPVNRDPEIQAARLRLPILAEEQVIMETINENSITIVAGETGSGKTTQIPQFLYESGYAEHKLIGITEPRRVAAISMSKRVAHEMNLSEKEVSYLIRFEGNVTDQTKIKFMTDGVLLKEIESDFLLLKYSVIILDEAHERSAYTDILIGLLSRIVPLRLKKGNPLKLIIMSATLRVEDFLENSKLFRVPPPLLKVEARQFPVTIHFQKTTAQNYVDEAFRKTLKIHAKLPEGGILIFVTGQQEVTYLVKKLKRTFPYNPAKKVSVIENKSETPQKEIDQEDDDEFDMKKAIKNVRKFKKKFLNQISLPKINLDDYKLPSDDTEADLLEGDDQEITNFDEEKSDSDDDDKDEVMTSQPLWVLPLFSLLSSEKQSRIFQSPPEGCRLCIVSTNVAETSLTIPNIKYVVDSGRQKTRLYDKITGVSAFIVAFTSKASADQRAGRAGRTSAGHCYRLYSSAVYKDEFEEFSKPDIQKKPVDDLMMQMRCMGIDRVINFPFPSPPDPVQLLSAERRLIILGALGPKENPEDAKSVAPVTRLGQVIARFPVAPRFGKMLALSHQQNMLPYTVCLVAALSVQELLIEMGVEKDSGIGLNKWQRRRLSWASTGNFKLLGDPMVLLKAVGAAEYAGCKGELQTFCINNGIRQKALTEVRKLRVQLTNEINLNMTNVDLCVDPEMPPPTSDQARFLRQILLAGMGDRVARKIPLNEINDKDQKRKMQYAYNCLDMEEPVFMHSSSVLRKKQPEWVIYQEAYETQNGDSTKLFIRGITAIEPEWLLLYVPTLCNVRSIKEDPLPRYNAGEGKVYCFVDATFGKAAWEIPLAEVEMPLSEKACCYFGMFLLNGDVFPKLTEFRAKLKATPSSIVKSWSNLNESVTKFKRALIKKGINCKQKLLDEWQKDPNFLLQQYCDLLFEVKLAELSALWPPVDSTR